MIGDRIQYYRKQQGLSLEELAQRAGVAEPYLKAVEQHIKTNPSVYILARLANVLQVPIHELQKQEEMLDKEWLQLTKEAMDSGISKDEFRQFLDFNHWESDQ